MSFQIVAATVQVFTTSDAKTHESMEAAMAHQDGLNKAALLAEIEVEVNHKAESHVNALGLIGRQRSARLNSVREYLVWAAQWDGAFVEQTVFPEAVVVVEEVAGEVAPLAEEFVEEVAEEVAADAQDLPWDDNQPF